MFRTMLSIAALSALLGAPPADPAASQATGAARTDAKAAPASKAKGASASKNSATAVVNLNTASASEIEALPGIGAKTAVRIVEYRQKNGPFKKIEELMNVRGVGEKNFLKLKPQITIAPAKADHDHPGGL
jgi:competence protein ComEA